MDDRDKQWHDGDGRRLSGLRSGPVEVAADPLDVIRAWLANPDKSPLLDCWKMTEKERDAVRDLLARHERLEQFALDALAFDKWTPEEYKRELEQILNGASSRHEVFRHGD